MYKISDKFEYNRGSDYNRNGINNSISISGKQSGITEGDSKKL
jgi:hypothetical protein